MKVPKYTRDGVLFISGLLGIAFETLSNSGERPTLLILFAAMCGLPVFLRGDMAIKRDSPTPPPTTDAPPLPPAETP